MELGVLIKAARKEAGLTQEQAAEALHVSRQTLSNWETGKTYPDILSVINMSALYSVSLDRLLKEESSMKQTYKEYLEESTNTVRSKDRNAKLVLLLTILGVWALSILFLGLVYSGIDPHGYSMIVVWIVLPVTLFTSSILVGLYSFFKGYQWLFALCISFLYTLTSYATNILSLRTADPSIFWPSFARLPLGLFLSFLGLGIGMLLKKGRATNS